MPVFRGTALSHGQGTEHNKQNKDMHQVGVSTMLDVNSLCNNMSVIVTTSEVTSLNIKFTCKIVVT